MILVVGDVVDDIGVRPMGTVNANSDTIAEIRMTLGGSAANVASWLGHLGTKVRFVGRTGVEGAARHTAGLEAFGVEACIAADDTLPTATIVLTLDEAADRTMYVDRGANTALTRADLPERVWDDVSWLHLTGYSLFDAGVRPVALELIAEARRRSVGVSVDPSSLGFLEAVGRDEFCEWLDGVDLVFPNDDEQGFLALDGPGVVVTRGADGARFGDDGVMAVPTDVVDTTGAGDAFCAGFLSQWVAGASSGEALAAGARAAAGCVGMRGARPEVSSAARS